MSKLVQLLPKLTTLLVRYNKQGETICDMLQELLLQHQQQSTIFDIIISLQSAITHPIHFLASNKLTDDNKLPFSLNSKTQ